MRSVILTALLLLCSGVGALAYTVRDLSGGLQVPIEQSKRVGISHGGSYRHADYSSVSLSYSGRVFGSGTEGGMYSTAVGSLRSGGGVASGGGYSTGSSGLISKSGSGYAVSSGVVSVGSRGRSSVVSVRRAIDYNVEDPDRPGWYWDDEAEAYVQPSSIPYGQTRIYNGKAQYWNGSEWVDNLTPEVNTAPVGDMPWWLLLCLCVVELWRRRRRSVLAKLG